MYGTNANLFGMGGLRGVCLFDILILYVPVNSYGHVGMSPPILWDFYPTLR